MILYVVSYSRNELASPMAGLARKRTFCLYEGNANEEKNVNRQVEVKITPNTEINY